MKKYMLIFLLLIVAGCTSNGTVPADQNSGPIEVDDTCPPSDYEYKFYYGDSEYVGDYTVTIQDITIGSVDVDVDGSSSYISTGSHLEINGLDVSVLTTDVQESVESSSAVLSFSC
ncbi:hypothetical protein COV16_03515 [Candidatus Woesearchaeota archaeon CG10_big_fil_rev_8_21_14_0_10_34_8]|nr:MAG: hypothetical protein COV16_03515 [Candidatus Woesearchaeota archaeon CG10_big_fil_rev_8_21_14_0_10_34_8]